MLLKDYYSEKTTDLTRWFISDCIYQIQSKNFVKEYLDIVSNGTFGRNRQMIVLLLGKLKEESAIPTLIDLLEDEYNAPLESDLQNVIYHIAVGHGGDAVRPRFGTNIIFQKKIKHGQLFYVLQYFIRTFVFADFSDTRDKSGIVPRESEARSVLIVV